MDVPLDHRITTSSLLKAKMFSRLQFSLLQLGSDFHTQDDSFHTAYPRSYSKWSSYADGTCGASYGEWAYSKF